MYSLVPIPWRRWPRRSGSRWKLQRPLVARGRCCGWTTLIHEEKQVKEKEVDTGCSPDNESCASSFRPRLPPTSPPGSLIQSSGQLGSLVGCPSAWAAACNLAIVFPRKHFLFKTKKKSLGWSFFQLLTSLLAQLLLYLRTPPSLGRSACRASSGRWASMLPPGPPATQRPPPIPPLYVCVSQLVSPTTPISCPASGKRLIVPCLRIHCATSKTAEKIFLRAAGVSTVDGRPATCSSQQGCGMTLMHLRRRKRDMDHGASQYTAKETR